MADTRAQTFRLAWTYIVQGELIVQTIEEPPTSVSPLVFEPAQLGHESPIELQRLRASRPLCLPWKAGQIVERVVDGTRARFLYFDGQLAYFLDLIDQCEYCVPRAFVVEYRPVESVEA